MKEKNLFNYLKIHKVEVPENINISIVSLPSLISKTTEIKKSKNENKHANMKFTFSDPEYSGLGDKFEWAKSCIVISYNYIPKSVNNHSFAPGEGAIALFAAEDHYKPLKRFMNNLIELFDNKHIQTHEFIDSPQHYDRIFFNTSGLGWQGKSNQKKFSCGSCNLCQISCPTGALDEEYTLDSNKCISYWLQSPEIIPHDMRSYIGNRFYGCDECLTSCPPGQTKDFNIDLTSKVDLKRIIKSTRKQSR